MNGADLRGSLLNTLQCLLEGSDNLKLQIAEAKKVIVLSFDKNDADMQPLSLERDAVWYNYLVSSLKQTEKDISLVVCALKQLGVSVSLKMESSNEDSFYELLKNRGDSALGFSVAKERE